MPSESAPKPPPLQMWAGVECTVNRVGDTFHDQLVRTGHDRRDGDLKRLAELGVKVVRYPVLWERTWPDPTRPPDWTWADARLNELRELGVRPVVGLVHHGSGPAPLSLVDPGFAPGLAAFAALVAERYPWVDAYTPVNEPLTTARFAGLYGHWFPHGRDDSTFTRALLNQCKGVVLAMQAVRRVNPAARLVQTEDLGETHAPPPLAGQADFENARRWLSWDLLAGKVNRRHPLWHYLTRDGGASEAELCWFAEQGCPPGLLGVNHYLTSERYLDDRVEAYAPQQVGGNRRRPYADVEAVRVPGVERAGPAGLLVQAWERYRLPIAVTEAHLGCTREEQLRWLAHVWDSAHAARRAGAAVEAVTAWSAFGSCDWDSLVTLDRGRYEPGLFDARVSPPRPTALAGMVARLAAGEAPSHPVLGSPGWWERPERFGGHHHAEPTAGPRGAPILITGAAGPLARAFARVCHARGLPVELLKSEGFDSADPAAVREMLAAKKPWAVVNAAGYAGVDAAENDRERCRRENALAPAALAEACASRRVRLVTFSTDLVFDGLAARPYHETDAVSPVNVYGRTKAEAEALVAERLPDALVVRTSALFGPWDDARNFVRNALDALGSGGTFSAADDLTVTASYLPDLAHAVLDLLIDGAGGVWHLANPEPTTWADLARSAATRAGFDANRVAGRPAAAFNWPAPRPAYSALSSGRGVMLPPLFDCLDRFLREAAPLGRA